MDYKKLKEEPLKSAVQQDFFNNYNTPSFYDIRLHFQGTNDKGTMNAKSDDATYTELIANLREKTKLLAKRIEPKVYEYGF